MAPEEKREQVFWHIAPKQAEFVAELIHKATLLYLKGDIGQWFWNVTALREIINYDLKEDERKKLDNMETKTKKNLGAWTRYSKMKAEGMAPHLTTIKRKTMFSEDVRQYQRKVFDALKALGYFPDKEDRTTLQF